MAATDEELRAALTAFRADAPRDARHQPLRDAVLRLGFRSAGRVIHGMADAGEAFVMVMHRLVERFTCIGYELPNGASDRSHLARYTNADYTGDLLALLDHLNFDRAAVVGSSFGSIVALSALAAAPGQFTHGILQNGFVYRPLNRYQRALARLARFWPGWFADWPEIHGFVMRRIERRTIAAVPVEIAKFFLRNGARTPIAACARRALAIDRTDLRPRLPTIRTPVLLITGDCDSLVPRVCWDEIEARLPGVKRVEFAGCGHYPQCTHPDLMAEAVGEFLDLRPRAAPIEARVL